MMGVALKLSLPGSKRALPPLLACPFLFVVGRVRRTQFRLSWLFTPLITLRMTSLDLVPTYLDGSSRSRDWWQSNRKEVHQKHSITPPFFTLTNLAERVIQYWYDIFGVYWDLRSLDRISTLGTLCAFID